LIKNHKIFFLSSFYFLLSKYKNKMKIKLHLAAQSACVILSFPIFIISFSLIFFSFQNYLFENLNNLYSSLSRVSSTPTELPSLAKQSPKTKK